MIKVLGLAYVCIVCAWVLSMKAYAAEETYEDSQIEAE